MNLLTDKNTKEKVHFDSAHGARQLYFLAERGYKEESEEVINLMKNAHDQIHTNKNKLGIAERVV